jgi:hypothetical protein
VGLRRRFRLQTNNRFIQTESYLPNPCVTTFAHSQVVQLPLPAMGCR